MHTPTFGERAVGISFNVSGDPLVADIKADFAKIIDTLHNRREMPGTSSEVKRQLSIAITEAQTSQMWAVKAVTWRE